VKRKTKLGILVGATRASSFVLGSIALGASNFLQVLGYVLALAGLPEILLIRGLRNEALPWTILGGVVVFAGSLLWVDLVSRTVGAMGQRTEGTGR